MWQKRTALAVFLLIMSVNTFAYVAISGAGGASLGQEAFGFATLAVRTDGSPWVFGVDFGWEDARVAFNADDWFVHRWLVYPAALYVLWGISGDVKLEGDFYATTGARLGVGANVLFCKRRNVELFAQAVWNPCVGVKVDEDDDEAALLFLPACFPVSGGLRLWLK